MLYPINNLKIEEFIFDDSNDVTFFCNVIILNEENSISLGLQFSEFDFLLRNSGKDGEKILEIIAAKLSSDYLDTPTVIDVENILRQKLNVTSFNLEIYRCIEQEDNNEWVDDEDNIYILDKIEKMP